MGDVPATCAAADEIVNSLTEITDDLAGCQPPRPDIVKWYVVAYHERIYSSICLFLDSQEVLDTMEKKWVLSLVSWIYSFHEQLVKLDVVQYVDEELQDHPAMESLSELVPMKAGYLRKRVNRAQQKGVKAYKKNWYKLENCVLCYWKNEPNFPDEPPLGDMRMDQLRSVVVHGKTMVLSAGDIEICLLAP